MAETYGQRATRVVRRELNELHADLRDEWADVREDIGDMGGDLRREASEVTAEIRRELGNVVTADTRRRVRDLAINLVGVAVVAAGLLLLLLR